MSEETKSEDISLPIEALLAEVTAIDPRIIPLAVERLRNRILQAEVEQLRGARGEP